MNAGQSCTEALHFLYSVLCSRTLCQLIVSCQAHSDAGLLAPLPPTTHKIEWGFINIENYLVDQSAVFTPQMQNFFFK